MDNTKQLPSLLSFCTGYGGIERGIKRVIGEFNIVAHVEIEAFAIANLVGKMESARMVPAPIWTNVKTFPVEAFRGKVDILTAGYPCQPFSNAGQRKGTDDPRHLWPYIARAISIIQPTICFFENVEGHISLGLREVLTDLVDLGYRVETDGGEATWGIFSASEVGAPHQRKRVFILAYRDSCRGWKDIMQTELRTNRLEQSSRDSWQSNEGKTQQVQKWPARPGEEQYEWEKPRVI